MQFAIDKVTDQLSPLVLNPVDVSSHIVADRLTIPPSGSSAVPVRVNDNWSDDQVA